MTFAQIFTAIIVGLILVAFIYALAETKFNEWKQNRNRQRRNVPDC